MVWICLVLLAFLSPTFIDPLNIPERRKFVDFGKAEELSKWITTSDKSVGGFSDCKFKFNEDHKYSSFSGNLSTKTGKGMHRSGYCAIRSRTIPWRLWGSETHDFSFYNKLVLEVRGDGRTYIANLNSNGLQKEDVFQHFIYTRGGPSWEKIELPFKDFLLTYRGYIQNEQSFVNLNSISHLGFVLSDGIDGPFRLDIKSIELVK